MRRRGRIQDIMQQSRDEERRVDTRHMQRSAPRQSAKLVGRGRVATSGETEQLPDERHGVEVVLPDVKAPGAKLGGDGLMVRV